MFGASSRPQPPSLPPTSPSGRGVPWWLLVFLAPRLVRPGRSSDDLQAVGVAVLVVAGAGVLLWLAHRAFAVFRGATSPERDPAQARPGRPGLWDDTVDGPFLR